MNAGLSDHEGRDRVHIIAREFLGLFQGERTQYAEMDTAGAMIWGSFKATDLGKEFMAQKFIEHPKVSSILSLTSLEREGKSNADALKLLEVEENVRKANDRRLRVVEKDLEKIKKKWPFRSICAPYDDVAARGSYCRRQFYHSMTVLG